MTKLRLLNESRGFTIVETLIVLAIAGLILMIVFLAVPALERSNRNHLRRQDVQNILQAAAHWELNHSGNFPTFAPAGPGCNPDDNFLQYTNLVYYDPCNVSSLSTGLGNIPGGYPPLPTSNPSTALDIVKLYNHEKCSSNGDASSAGASYSDVVALYAVETGSNSMAAQCQQL